MNELDSNSIKIKTCLSLYLSINQFSIRVRVIKHHSKQETDLHKEE